MPATQTASQTTGLDRIGFSSAGAMTPAAKRRAELFAMFDRMDFAQLAGVYEQAQADGDAEIVRALDAYHA